MEEWHSANGTYSYNTTELQAVAKRFKVIESHVILQATAGKPAEGYTLTKGDMENGARKELAEIRAHDREMAWASWMLPREESGVSGPCVPCQAKCTIS